MLNRTENTTKNKEINQPIYVHQLWVHSTFAGVLLVWEGMCANENHTTFLDCMVHDHVHVSDWIFHPFTNNNANMKTFWLGWSDQWFSSQACQIRTLKICPFVLLLDRHKRHFEHVWKFQSLEPTILDTPKTFQNLPPRITPTPCFIPGLFHLNFGSNI